MLSKWLFPLSIVCFLVLFSLCRECASISSHKVKIETRSSMFKWFYRKRRNLFVLQVCANVNLIYQFRFSLRILSRSLDSSKNFFSFINHAQVCLPACCCWPWSSKWAHLAKSRTKTPPSAISLPSSIWIRSFCSYSRTISRWKSAKFAFEMVRNYSRRFEVFLCARNKKRKKRSS